MYFFWYSLAMDDKCPVKKITVKFYMSDNGDEPVKEWLHTLDREDKKTIGEDIKEVELGWPIGMPLVRKFKNLTKIWEIRSDISDGRIARVLFTVVDHYMVLLHGFIKKTQSTPKVDKDKAIARRKLVIKR